MQHAPIPPVARSAPALELARLLPLARCEQAAPHVSQLIGRTPCVLLAHLGADAPRAAILAKLEGLNPGGSVKDRTALGMALVARADGALAPGRPIVEATAGNTGIGLALVGRALGHPVTLVMPARYSAEKRSLACALGARVITVPGAAAGMAECMQRAQALAREEGALVLDQFRNPANPGVHEATTGPELLAQCGGDVDAVVIGVGTGGTLTGVARALRASLPALRVVAVESQGSVIGGGLPRPTRIEGIGSTFVPPTLDLALVDEVVTVCDEDAFHTARRAAREEGLLCGPSGGAILFAALDVARRLGPGRRVATLVPDGAERYWTCGLHADH